MPGILVNIKQILDAAGLISLAGYALVMVCLPSAFGISDKSVCNKLQGPGSM